MSWYNIRTVLFFIVISRSFQGAPITKRTLFFRRPDFDRRLVHNWTAVRASSGVWECAANCSADSDCLSVAFKPMSEECFVYQRSVSTTDHFTLSLSVTLYGVCPSGFSVLSRRCVKIVTDKLNWNSAREHCRDTGAELITIESQAKMSTFRDLMLANGYGSNNNYFWCGASEVNGVWQWIDGKTFSSSSDLWCNNEPGGAHEHCTMVLKQAVNCFHDARCDTHHPFVCEIQI